MSQEEVTEKRYTFKVSVDITEDATGESLKFHECPAVWYHCKERGVVLMEGELIEMLKRMNQHAANRLDEQENRVKGGSKPG